MYNSELNVRREWQTSVEHTEKYTNGYWGGCTRVIHGPCPITSHPSIPTMSGKRTMRSYHTTQKLLGTGAKYRGMYIDLHVASAASY